ncbi:MAG TPA: T9SS type A sorting domain-containing protein [Bacteroidales bacterium]|nr:T9SS type A sorting domain-containing protein [Bacteroidales bacterium]HPS16159.1 T9SS type A sorting domain-containing protein [Bacteroidales bacterium]
MKKFTLIITTFLVFAALLSNAQITNGGFELWTAGKPDGWYGSKTQSTSLTVAKDSVNVHGGVYACALTNTYSAHRRFTTTSTSVTNGTAYVISFWVKGTGTVRTGMYTGKSGTSYGYLTYNAYATVTSSWTQVSQTLVPDTTTNLAEFIIDAGASSTFTVDDVTVTSGTVPTVTIHDIQYSTTSPYASPYSGQAVNTGGIVTGKFNKGIFIQDASGPWNGLYVYDSAHVAAAGIVVGDSITISGTVSEYHNYTELGSINNITKVSSGNTAHAAYAVSKANSTTEELEGVLVTLTNIPCIEVTDASYGEFVLYNGDTTRTGGKLYKYTNAIVGTNYDVTGIVYLDYNDTIRVEPRDVNDVSVSSGIVENNKNSLSIYPNPVTSNLFIENMNGIEKIRISNILGATIEDINVTSNNTSVNTDKLSKGIYFITLFNNKGISETRKFSKE